MLFTVYHPLAPREEIDLTYEGIATPWFISIFNISSFSEEIDLTYEGIATMIISTVVYTKPARRN